MSIKLSSKLSINNEISSLSQNTSILSSDYIPIQSSNSLKKITYDNLNSSNNHNTGITGFRTKYISTNTIFIANGEATYPYPSSDNTSHYVKSPLPSAIATETMDNITYYGCYVNISSTFNETVSTSTYSIADTSWTIPATGSIFIHLVTKNSDSTIVRYVANSSANSISLSGWTWRRCISALTSNSSSQIEPFYCSFDGWIRFQTSNLISNGLNWPNTGGNMNIQNIVTPCPTIPCQLKVHLIGNTNTEGAIMAWTLIPETAKTIFTAYNTSTDVIDSIAGIRTYGIEGVMDARILNDRIVKIVLWNGAGSFYDNIFSLLAFKPNL